MSKKLSNKEIKDIATIIATWKCFDVSYEEQILPNPRFFKNLAEQAEAKEKYKIYKEMDEERRLEYESMYL